MVHPLSNMVLFDHIAKQLNSQRPLGRITASCTHRTRSLEANATLKRQLLLAGGFLLGSARVSQAMHSNGEDQAAKVLQDPRWPEDIPFEPDDFQRYDESSDKSFYAQPRFVTHIDDAAIAALTKYYEHNLPTQETAAVLDMCSSWISHYPKGFSPARVVGMGMNEEELKRNPALTEYKVKDLNVDAHLPYESNTFDAITNVVSVDYLSRPLEIFKEMHRVLKPGGRAIMSFSNRCFPTKAVAVWTRTGDLEHVYIVGSYFHYSVPAGWSAPEGLDISPKATLFGKTDPMYVVTAKKL